MKGKNTRRTHGTTLVELLMTIVFLAVAVAPILTLISSSQSRANETRQRTIALGIAQDEIEKAKSNNRNEGGVSKGAVVTTLTPVGALYPLKVTVNVTAVTSFKDIYEAEVEVVYDDKNNKIRLHTRFKS